MQAFSDVDVSIVRLHARCFHFKGLYGCTSLNFSLADVGRIGKSSHQAMIGIVRCHMDVHYTQRRGESEEGSAFFL